MERLLPYVIALLVLAIANLGMNILVVKGYLFGGKPKVVRIIEAPYRPAQQTQEPAGQERPAVPP